MSSAKTHIQSIVSAVEELGYTFTDEYFDFETTPASGNDKVYRLEAQTGEVTGLTGNRVEKRKNFDFWVAYKLQESSNRQQDVYNVLDAKETLEDDIFLALSGVQVRILQNIMSAIKNDYIIVKCSGQVIYWREITAS